MEKKQAIVDKGIDFVVSNLGAILSLTLSVCETFSPFPNVFEPQLWPRIKYMTRILQCYYGKNNFFSKLEF